ncbi:MAG: MFS transporter [Gammaproteobacteria bacterium]
MTIAYAARQPCDKTRAEFQRRIIPCPQRDKPWILATAILGSSLAFIESSVVNLALPALQTSLQATSTDLQWVINAYLLVLGSFMLIGGSLGDRYGLRRIFISGTAIFGIGGLGCALASSLPMLIVARLVQGFGGALLVPTSLALIGKHFDVHERGRAIGTWAGASALTTALGPVIGGWLVDRWGWQAVFLLMPPFALVTILIAWWRVPVSPAENKTRLDYPGALLLAGTLGLLIYALVNSAGIAQKLLLSGLAVLFGAIFLQRERVYATPMLPLGLFRSRPFSGANFMTLLLYCALSGALYFLPFNLIQVQGYSALQAGAAFLPFTLILGLGSTFAGGMIRRFNARVVLTLGPLITALGFIILAIPGMYASYLNGFLPGIVIISIGMTVSVAPLTTVVMDSVSEAQAGIASGVNNTAARFAGVLAVAAFTAIAVGYFSGALDERLREHGVPPVLVKQLNSHATQLAKLTPPSEVSESLRISIRDAVGSAYVDMFRILLLLCAALAALSGVIAWLSIREVDHGSSLGKRI